MAEAATTLKQPHGLSPRVQRLRDFYFEGVGRPWNNEFLCFTTGTPWDVVFDELSYYIVPETYAFFQPFRSSALQAARIIPVPGNFWSRSLPERRAWFVREAMARHVPKEILPGSLLAGSRFNLLASRCWTREEAQERDRLVLGPRGVRQALLDFHLHGQGNAGATSGHLIPDHERLLRIGWKGIHADLLHRLDGLPADRAEGPEGAQLRAMVIAATMARDVAAGYAEACTEAASRARTVQRANELREMARMLRRVPWEPPANFWEAVQALWLNHMLILSDENYPGAGVSFGRIDQYLRPFWERSLAEGMPREFGKEVLRCLFVHCNTAYDAMIRVGGNQGITAGFGQLLTLSGMGEGGRDLTNDLTFAFLEVIDEMSPILEPKPNVRLHRGSPDALLDRLVEMIARSQGAPFLLNFDERSMAGLIRQARRAGLEDRIHEGNVHDYAPVGCLENTMVGNDRSGTVDINLNLLKAVEFALTGGFDLHPPDDPITGRPCPAGRLGPDTGPVEAFRDFESFLRAYEAQTRDLVRRAVELYDRSDAIRARFCPTPYLSCMVRGCAEKGRDITEGQAAEIDLVTLEAVTFATTVDSLLAVRHLVFEQRLATLPELVQALRDDWKGHERLQAHARFRAPKYGRDDDEADAMARHVMEVWTEEAWRHRTRSTGRQVRPGMLSWNYWIGDAHLLAASPDGRPRGQFLSNAICPSNGADTKGPTANVNSVGKALGGRRPDGDFRDYCNLLPNGASHTMTFSPALFRDPEHRRKFRDFLRGTVENGGTALQVNVIDPGMLRDAQRHPEAYRHLLVRVTGYNAYFTSIGRELQDEIIARESHRNW
ncbi:hypothetical protein KBD49_12205 [Myxococcota bacterium]|jgi:formate C-acetyltransferase|nr:hypothetical protein [Myxococcota bacterium]